MSAATDGHARLLIVNAEDQCKIGGDPQKGIALALAAIATALLVIADEIAHQR